MLRRILAIAVAAASLAGAHGARAQGGTRLPQSAAVGQMEYAALAAQGATTPGGAVVGNPRAMGAVATIPAHADTPLPDSAPQNNDYTANMASDAFGAQLFTGAFSRDSASVFNPSHVISVGDRIQLRIWNGYNVDTVLTVDAGGNIVLPEVGPFRVQGITNGNLQTAVGNALRRVFASKVSIYASRLA